jgi:cobalt/nickel transport system permease protein
MHIPDGFVDAKTAATAAVLSTAGLAVALRRVRRELAPRRTPLLGLSAAFLFAAQMVNFPVAAGTSGHLMGGVLVAVLLGPSAAIVVLATVLVVQCFLFADGGVSALGANLFNMGLLGAGGGYLIYWALAGRLRGLRGRVAAIAFAGWCSVVLAAIGCAGQLAWSHTAAFSAALPMMASVHMLVGVGEGLISALVYLAIVRARPDLAGPTASPVIRRDGAWGYGLLAALGIALFVAPFASPLPDGLETVAARLGVLGRSADAVIPAVAPDYRLPGIHSAVAATALAGLAGTVVVFGLALLLGRILVRDPSRESARDSSC